MHQREIIVPLPGPRHAREYLEHYGFKRPVRVHSGILFVLAVPLVALVLALALHGLKFRGVEIKATDVVIATAGLGALLVGYHQWREARHELSMERYYERLEIPNRRHENRQSDGRRIIHEKMKACLPELESEDPDWLMYVYVELGNLEYVIGKYKLGYMRAKQACRGLRTFQLRC